MDRGAFQQSSIELDENQLLQEAQNDNIMYICGKYQSI